ncbi:MAG: hypothetical protein HY876_09110 [Coriobacteriales bacterium]|nr:hypothetical protein [Coriobacteriales bacterium]
MFGEPISAQNRDECTLRAASGTEHAECDGSTCIYWRVVDHLGVTDEVDGCAIEHFRMLEGGEEVATWLLSVKERVERA